MRRPILLKIVPLGTWIALCLLWSVAQAAPRTFSSAQGQTMRAEIVSFDTQAKTVTLIRIPDGRHFTVPWSLFSVEDQQYLAALGQEARPQPVSTVPVPPKVRLRGVPMVVQKGSLCVPASAAMIAQYHGLNVDQELIATLSSAGSIGHAGTYPSDMALAMEKLGFETRIQHWNLKKGELEVFENEVLPLIREAIATQGPVYVSYRAGVFGTSGHGCVIVGYDDSKKQFDLHNPWGRKFRENYDDFFWKTRGTVAIAPLSKHPVASEAYTQRVLEQITILPPTMEAMAALLEQLAGLTTRFTYCSRRDERGSRRFAEQTARREGRLILDLAFMRSSAVILPRCDAGGVITGLYFVTEPDSGARFNCRYFDGKEWHPPQLLNIGDLNKNWAMRVADLTDNGQPVWDLPLLELVE